MFSPILTFVLPGVLFVIIVLVLCLVRRKVPKTVSLLLVLALVLCAALAVFLAWKPKADAPAAEQAEKTRHIMVEGLYAPITLKEAAEEAYTIVCGEVDALTQTRLIADYRPDGSPLFSECYTIHMIHVSEAIKDGGVNDSAAILLLPGGETDTDIYIADYAPAAEPGDRVVAFIGPNDMPIRPQYVFVEKDGKVYVPFDSDDGDWQWIETEVFLDAIKNILQ